MELVVQLHDCDIFAICETFLRGNETLSIENYTWVGNIRLNINPNARRGSGGVGTFIKNEFLTKYTCVTDKSMEDTLILKFTHRIDSSVLVLFMLFATDCSTRAVDADVVFNESVKKVYEYQSEGEIIICGDFNSRLGSESDYIEGVDAVKPREIIDTSANSYCDILSDFLIDCNLCILNGRLGKNDFTHISTRGKSVVDYVFVPHEQLSNFCDFCTAIADVFNDFNLQDYKSSDHSIQLWSKRTREVKSPSEISVTVKKHVHWMKRNFCLTISRHLSLTAKTHSRWSPIVLIE